MKNCKKISAVILSVSCFFACLPAKAYVDKEDIVVSMKQGDPAMYVNGRETEVDPGRGTAPVISNGRTLVPIRAVIEAFGGKAEWRDDTRSVRIVCDGDEVCLVIDEKTAYLNGKAYTLDTAPTIVNGRTMLPLRFVAEGFGLGVAWEADTKTITVIRNSFDKKEYERLCRLVPAYSGEAYVRINDNVPFFEDYEIIKGSFEYYSKLDETGRCDVCMASVAEDTMPTEKRGNISSVKPTGWINAKYDCVPGKYLYNRCHLIGYQLTGENANERNLITGTRYLNAEGMLPFENAVDSYVDETKNHVVYRVTPVFKDNNLVADGVLMEAYSAEDNGEGLSFCVYCHNVQPTIFIDYLTGKSWAE